MKVIYNGVTDGYLTNGSTYYAFEVYARIDTGLVMIRLIDNFGRPILMESKNFLYETMSLDNLDVSISDDMLVATLPEIMKMSKEKSSVIELWDLYFNNNPLVVEKMGSVIEEYAKKSKILIHKPFSYRVIK